MTDRYGTLISYLDGLLRQPALLNYAGLYMLLDRAHAATIRDALAEAQEQPGIFTAVTLAGQYGMIDGAHHKQWVIDQMVRVLLGPEGYAAWLATENVPGYDLWDEGIAP